MGITSRITKALIRESHGLTGVQVLKAAGLQGEVSAVLTSSSAVNCFGKQPWPAC